MNYRGMSGGINYRFGIGLSQSWNIKNEWKIRRRKKNASEEFLLKKREEARIKETIESLQKRQESLIR